ncbi:MAG: aromatic amino acid ammonia-lyase [Flavobacteriales bacterium]|nr:aromatic amino acid ammonia-lyase [Flavobacteriales bacterium]MDW8410193.1 aromatic amino acid ammonia-lyase [Flavobacteriales bacterium]
MMAFGVGEEKLTPDLLYALAKENRHIELRFSVRTRINENRRFLERKLEEGAFYYGVNTGFGKLCEVRIQPQELRQLQVNLIHSHSCGVGPLLPYELSRMVLALKIHSLALGASGVREILCDYLLEMWRSGVAPAIPTRGSLGASGDLAPLAYVAAPILGLGQVMKPNGELLESKHWLKEAGLSPLELESKEGLALLNGTQYMAALASYVVARFKKLWPLIGEVYGLSSWAYGALRQPLDKRLLSLRPHEGQLEAGALFNAVWDMLPPQTAFSRQVQDPYSFRCMPQVAGASLDALRYMEKVVTTELNSVTDNPVVLHKEGQILSGGHFHGQPLALVCDFAAIALAELASIAERRIYRLLSGKNGLPPFLADDPGLESGYMIVQYTAAALVSHNKQLCTPASVDSIESSDGQEDHVSMGANAALKLLEVWDNTLRVVALEWLTALRAALFRTQGDPQPFQTLPTARHLLNRLRPHRGDVWMHDRLQAAIICMEELTL